MSPRYALRRLMRRFPLLFNAYVRARHPGRVVGLAGRGTELVIEGFPRCANTFAYYAFLQAQGREVAVAHHLHSPSQVVFAAARGIPCLVLLREPEGALVSFAQRHPEISPRRMLDDYLHFYGLVAARRGRVLSADFRAVTSDFGAVIDALNRRFGTAFDRFEHTGENVEQVFATIGEINRRSEGGASSQIAIPSAEKEAARGRDGFAEHLLAGLDPAGLEEARGLYRTLAGADAPGPGRPSDAGAAPATP